MFDLRLEANVVVAREGGEGGVDVGAFGDELLGSSFGCGWVLRYRGLNTFDGEPMCYCLLAR